MKRRISWMLIVTILLTLFAGCSQPATTEAPVTEAATEAVTEALTEAAPEAATEATTEPATEDVAKATFPLTVTDQLGNSVTLEAPAERIVSGYYISSSACLALGLKDKLVGTEEKIDVRPIYGLSAPELIGNIANVGNAKNFDLEACLAAEPDLVILPKNAKDYAATLAETGIPAIVVNPESHEALEEMIGLIASLTGTEERASELTAFYQEALSKAEERTKDIADADKPKVYMASPSAYLTTAPKDMYQASVIRAAGGTNACDELEGDYWVEVSYEQVLTMNPDMIIIPSNNTASGAPDYSAEDILADENLAGVTAVENKAVYNMPVGLEALDSPVPSGVLGTLWMLNKLHPDVYTLDELKADAQAFYSTFYGFDVDTGIFE